MKKITQQRIEDDGTKITTTFCAIDNKLSTKVGRGLSKLIENIFYETTQFDGITINITKVAEGYDYDITYGQINPPFKIIAELQEFVKRVTDEFIRADSSTKGATLTTSYTHQSPDIFGIKRLAKYLIGVKY